MTIRTLTDQELDEAVVAAVMTGNVLLLQDLQAEISRRATIRLERGECGEMHDASWYEPRPLLTDEDLDEMATRAIEARSSALIQAAIAASSGRDLCESGWTGDRCAFRLDHASPHSNEEGMILDQGWGVR